MLQGLAYGKSSLDPDRQLRGPFERVRPQAEYLQRVVPPDEEVLSSDSQLVPFMADRRILHGYESFEFFPFWSTEKCRLYGVVNEEMIIEHLRSATPAAVLINDMSYRKPFPVSVDWGPESRNRILDALEERYELGATFPSPYFEGGSSYVYVRRDP